MLLLIYLDMSIFSFSTPHNLQSKLIPLPVLCWWQFILIFHVSRPTKVLASCRLSYSNAAAHLLTLHSPIMALVCPQTFPYFNVFLLLQNVFRTQVLLVRLNVQFLSKLHGIRSKDIDWILSDLRSPGLLSFTRLTNSVNIFYRIVSFVDLLYFVKFLIPE